MLSTHHQVMYGDPADAGLYECVDCGHRVEIDPGTHAMPPCPNDDGHHHSRVWQAVDPNEPAREISGELPRS